MANIVFRSTAASPILCQLLGQHSILVHQCHTPKCMIKEQVTSIKASITTLISIKAQMSLDFITVLPGTK